MHPKKSWEAVLKNQKAIYVIVDTAKDTEYSGLGRLYVVKASANNGMLYSRFKNYADNLTEGNKELNKIKKRKR